MKTIFILSTIIFSIYFMINNVSSQSVGSSIYSENCIWFMKYNTDPTLTPDGTFENPFKSLNNAINKITTNNTINKCGITDKSTTRVLYIAASDKDDITNVYSRPGDNSYLTFNDIYFSFPILIQSIDQPATYKYDANQLLAMATTGRYATFLGVESDKYIMQFISTLTPFTFRGIQFRNGGHSKNDPFQASVIITSSSSVSFEQCLFRDNVGGVSGALFYSSRSAHIDGCIFSNNTASTIGSGVGGAINIPYAADKIYIRNSEFKQNSATNGGAIYCAHINLHLNTSTFIENTAAQMGGGLYTIRVPHTPQLSWEDLSFISNKAINGSGLYDFNSVNVYYNTIFRNNTASENGGGAYFLDSIVTIRNSSFENNQAVNGGAVYATDLTYEDKANQLYILYTNFKDNNAKSNGGALYCDKAIARFNIGDNYEDRNNLAGNSSSNIDYCTSSCITSAKDCACPGGCGIDIDTSNPNTNAKIAVAIFLPITAILLGIVGFLLWKTHSKSKMRTKVAPYDEIRLSPQSQDTMDDQL